MIDASCIKDIFSYCPTSGTLFWKVNRGGKVKSGSVVGSIRRDRSGICYLQTHYMGKWYFVHRLIWLYVYGSFPDTIDHINGDGLDNRLENLRSISSRENQKNKGVYRSSSSRVPGVHPKTGKWLVNICVDSKMIHLGTYYDLFEACCARKSAENKYGFYKNHGRQPERRHLIQDTIIGRKLR